MVQSVKAFASHEESKVFETQPRQIKAVKTGSDFRKTMFDK